MKSAAMAAAGWRSWLPEPPAGKEDRLRGSWKWARSRLESIFPGSSMLPDPKHTVNHVSGQETTSRHGRFRKNSRILPIREFSPSRTRGDTVVSIHHILLGAKKMRDASWRQLTTRS